MKSIFEKQVEDMDDYIAHEGGEELNKLKAFHHDLGKMISSLEEKQRAGKEGNAQ